MLTPRTLLDLLDMGYMVEKAEAYIERADCAAWDSASRRILICRNYTARNISFDHLFCLSCDQKSVASQQCTLGSPISFSQIPLKAPTLHEFEAARQKIESRRVMHGIQLRERLHV